jgi:hypothetical protein
VYDSAYQDVGALNSWSLIVTPKVGGLSVADTKVWALESGALAPTEFALASVGVAARPVSTRSISTAADHAPTDHLLGWNSIVTRQTLLAESDWAPSRTTTESGRLWSGGRASDVLFAEIGASPTREELSGRLESLLGLSRASPLRPRW